MRLLVTGGAGFIGSNFIRYILHTYPAYRVLNLDRLTYCGNLENLEEVCRGQNYEFVRGDIAEGELVGRLLGSGFDAIVNFAAESHVDRSIDNAGEFVRTNIAGTYNLLECARRARLARFVQISTDELYGALGSAGAFHEAMPLAPNSPYAASKASADLLARAYFQTYKLPVIITRCSNNYGPYQFPEKFIPLMISNALIGEPLPIYGDGLQVRDWIHVEDHCRALDAVLHRGREGEVYNVGGESERTNLETARLILSLLSKPQSLIRFVKDRPGHDRRYAMDIGKIGKELGWAPQHSFEAGLAHTIDWYRSHQDWVARARSGEFGQYYDKLYIRREETLADY